MIAKLRHTLLLTVIKRLLSLYVFTNRWLGTNVFTYTILGDEVTFTYHNRYQFAVFYDLIDNESIREEGIPLKYFSDLDQCDAFIDVGAYHGLYSSLVGKIDPEIAIYSFEPNPTNRRILTETLKTNDIEASVRSEVVTGETGEVTFYERAKHASQGNSTSPTAGASSSTKEAIALSDFFEREEVQAPFVKIDAEGEEDEIIRDLSTTSTLSFISGIVEIHPDKMDTTEEEIVKLFEEADWSWEKLGNTAKPGYTPRPAYFFTTE